MGTTFELSKAALVAALAFIPINAHADDIPGDSSSKAVLPLNLPVSGQFERVYDTDWFKLPITRDHHYALQIIPDEPVGINLKILDPADTIKFATGVDTGPNAATYSPRTEFTAKTNGYRWVAVRMTQPALSGAKQVSYRLVAVEECGNDRKTTCTAKQEGVNIGRTEFYGDIDWWKICVEAGRTYHVRLVSPFHSSHTIRIVDRDGVVDGVAEEGFTTFTAEYTGTYFADVEPLSTERNQAYNLYVTFDTVE